MTTFLIVIFLLVLIVIGFMQQPMFGATPKGKRQELIKQSQHFKNGQFQNLSDTPNFTEGATFYSILKEFFFVKHERRRPLKDLPSVNTDLHALPLSENVLVWFGHSSYYLQIDGKRFLVDPVFSGAASPIPPTTRSFKGADVYNADDIPQLDYLVITHDHWDHLDYKTVLKLKPKTGKVICGLGTGQHLERWGFDLNKIIERQWNEMVQLENGFTIHTAPARHFSGRGFKRNQSQWMSYVLQTPSIKIYIGGDSGYDTHFKNTGDLHGPFDLVILECGQYNKSWKYIHMLPDEITKAANDLKAKKLLAVHWGKFQLANHPWDEPIIKVSQYAAENNLTLLTPLIGEVVDLKNENQQFSKWWIGIN